MVGTGFRETNKGQCTILGLAILGNCYHSEVCFSTETEWAVPTRALIFALRDGAYLEGVRY